MNNFATRWVARWLQGWAYSYTFKREADFAIRPTGETYMLRWFVIPRNRFFNVYLHVMYRADDDRALHDHPWPSMSIMLSGDLREHYCATPKQLNWKPSSRVLREGSFVFRRARFAHRLEPMSKHVMTLFVTGPRVRQWGFWCPKGWRHWREFTSGTDGSGIGRGCE